MSNVTEIQVVDLSPQPEAKKASGAIALASPAQLVQMAIERGDGDLDRLERLMMMQERWAANEAKSAYNEAFAGFRAEPVKVLRDKARSSGPLEGQKYAQLSAYVNAATPALSKHGLSVAWSITKDAPDWIEVTCTIKHSKGHSESTSFGGPPDTGSARNPLQARASTVAYLKRYTFSAICGLADEDDDGAGGDAAPGNDAQSDMLAQGREAAMEGMAALTAWWGMLTAKQRSSMNKEFGGLRKAAQEADRA